MSNWIATVTGKKFYPLIPRPEDVDIRDIAHSLACIPRFNGHVLDGPYSVAQHSVLVSEQFNELPPSNRATLPLQLAGLLHDAAEAYIGDIARPWKSALWCKVSEVMMLSISETENRLLKTIIDGLGLEDILESFSLTEGYWSEVRQADELLLVAEGWKFFSDNPTYKDWQNNLNDSCLNDAIVFKVCEKLKPLGWHEARQLFLNRWNLLTGQSVSFMEINGA